MDGVVEIITSRKRWHWSTEKLRIGAELAEPGTRVRAVAARHGVCESLLFTCCRQGHDGVLVAPDMPVQVFGTPLAVPGLSRPEPRLAATPTTPALAPVLLQAGLIEIGLGDGRPQVHTGSDVNQAALRHVLAALRK